MSTILQSAAKSRDRNWTIVHYTFAAYSAEKLVEQHSDIVPLANGVEYKIDNVRSSVAIVLANYALVPKVRIGEDNGFKYMLCSEASIHISCSSGYWTRFATDMYSLFALWIIVYIIVYLYNQFKRTKLWRVSILNRHGDLYEFKHNRSARFVSLKWSEVSVLWSRNWDISWRIWYRSLALRSLIVICGLIAWGGFVLRPLTFSSQRNTS